MEKLFPVHSAVKEVSDLLLHRILQKLRPRKATTRDRKRSCRLAFRFHDVTPCHTQSQSAGFMAFRVVSLTRVTDRNSQRSAQRRRGGMHKPHDRTGDDLKAA